MKDQACGYENSEKRHHFKLLLAQFTNAELYSVNVELKNEKLAQILQEI